MFERDYILRMFTMLGRALARILFFKETKSYDAALLEIENSGLSFLGLNTETMERLPVDGLKDVLGTDPLLLQSRLYTAGVLLKEKAEILAAMGKEDDSVKLYLKSLRLLTAEIKGIDEIDDRKGIATVDSVIDKLNEYDIPDDLKRRLVEYYEVSSRYDKAEDLIFEIIESDPGFVPGGISFYERLLAMSDTELENGRLPRDEVLDALAALRKKSGGVEKD
jgi:tetratricopeptide (TPR) repeat protein